jgi:hypothetical protein
MKREAGQLVPKSDRVAGAVVAVVAVSVLMMFGLLYALTPPTVATVSEHQVTMNQR